jgi:uncharacterized integral membrane protein
MNKISTAVIVGIVCVVLLGVLIFLNRDKFHSSDNAAEAAAE